MLDFTKITFNEIDGTYVPLQIFYGYDLNKQEIKNLHAAQIRTAISTG